MRRFNEIVSHLKDETLVADVGCDHGYISQKLLESGGAKKVVMTDISAKCLKKAQDLLSNEIANGRATAIVCDGLSGVNLPITAVVIAGMGGEEIIKILSECLDRLPIKKVVLQPMKNADKVREFLVRGKFWLHRDYTFYDADKYYDLIYAEKLDGKSDAYSDLDIEFGRENLLVKSADFILKYQREIERLNTFLSHENLSDKSREELVKKINKYKTVIGEL